MIQKQIEIHQAEADAAMAMQAEGQEIEFQPNDILMSFEPAQLGTESEVGPTEPLSEDQAEYARGLIEALIMEDDDLIVINDRFAVKCGQEVFDDRWQRSRGEMQWVMNELYCNIFGFQSMRIQFHVDGPRKNLFTLENTHLMNVLIDPSHDSIDEADYFIYEHLISLDEAVTLYPQWEEKFQRVVKSGPIGLANRYQRRRSQRNITYYRDMVSVRTTWLRHQKMPMSEDEAIDQELVTPSEDGYTLNETNETVTPGSSGGGWPQKIGILQVMDLPDIDEIIEEVECPYMDIPFAWNVNLPIPYSPFGQGEPERLEDLQQQVNRLLSIFANYTMYYQFPARFWKQSVLERLKALNIPLHSRPGAEYPIPDDDYEKLAVHGRMCMVQEIPVMPAVLMDILTMLLAEMDRLSGNVEIRQGVPPSAGMSGKALDALRTESHGPLALRSKFTENAVERCANLVMDAIVKWLDDETWSEILDRYSQPVLDRVRDRLEYMKLDFRVEVAQGRGTNQEREEQRTMTLLESGLMSRRTAMENVRIEDVDDEIKRMQTEAAAEAGMVGPQSSAA